MAFSGEIMANRVVRWLKSVALLFLASCGSSEPNPVVVIDTSMGTIKAELFLDKAPASVKNFLMYVDDTHYDGTVFHRVIPDFMIQGGGFKPGELEKNVERETRAPIKNESGNGLENLRGTLAMARTGEPHSASDQFFINTKNNGFLNKAEARDKWGYAVFGKVIEGMDVVDKFRRVETGTVGTHDDVPAIDVVF